MTGAAGSIGQPLVDRLRDMKQLVFETDIDSLDVTNRGQVDDRIERLDPKVIYHMAGAKHAPVGEQDPEYAAHVNITGTANVIKSARGAKVVLASTCKACDPETAYGASKLIAERMVLNAGGVVVRYYNVRETAGNVFRLWEELPPDTPIPVADCYRYFISLDEAVDLTARALHLPTGKYTVDPGPPEWIPDVARRLYPGREQRMIARRRGDRKQEPLHAKCEARVWRDDGLLQIVSPYDPVPAVELQWAA